MDRILVALSADGRDSPPVGNGWRITSKGTDFYLDPIAETESHHLSAHGPNETHGGHRFHLKVHRKNIKQLREAGDMFVHAIPRKGFPFDGMQVADQSWLVARIRWTWHLQRPRFRQAAVTSLGRYATELDDHERGRLLSDPLAPNENWDVDLFVSYDRPYWPTMAFDPAYPQNARLEPLRNDAGLWLTGLSAHRSELRSPTPDLLIPPLPLNGEQPNRMSCAGPGSQGFYWFVETITTRALVEANR